MPSCQVQNRLSIFNYKSVLFQGCLCCIVATGARSEHSILLPYPEERQKPRQEGHGQQSEVCGWSFHHGAFVNNLRQAARSNPKLVK